MLHKLIQTSLLAFFPVLCAPRRVVFIHLLSQTNMQMPTGLVVSQTVSIFLPENNSICLGLLDLHEYHSVARTLRAKSRLPIGHALPSAPAPLMQRFSKLFASFRSSQTELMQLFVYGHVSLQ